jgi:hypothetical protein
MPFLLSNLVLCEPYLVLLLEALAEINEGFSTKLQAWLQSLPTLKECGN